MIFTRASAVRIAAVLGSLLVACSVRSETPPLRAGMIGLDTSHAPAFARALNNDEASGDLAKVEVVAALPASSDDLAASRDRVEGFTETLREMGIEIVDSMDALLERVDVVLIESVDGRPHLEQAQAVFRAGKPVFIDKPLAASLVDCLAIEALGEKYDVPWFSSSSLRFSPGTHAIRDGSDEVGEVRGAVAWSPCSLNSTHPDLYWYGVHGVETLYTLMGPGCETVTRAATKGTDHVTGVWEDGRIGAFHGIRDGKAGYGATVFGEKAITDVGSYGGYGPLVEQIATFFVSGEPPIETAETIELFAFMTAAEESSEQGGVPVTIESVMQSARDQLDERLREIGEE